MVRAPERALKSLPADQPGQLAQHAHGVTHEQALEYAADVLRQAVPVFDECQVNLAVEPLGPQEGNFLRTAALGRELIRLVDAPRVRLHLDVKAMSGDEAPPAEIIRRHFHRMGHFHANDANRRAPGMGDTDFLPILRALRDVQYRGYISIEVFDYKPDPESYLGVVDSMYLKPHQVMLCAAHNGDLAAAQKCGLSTGFVIRPTEHGPGQKIDLKPTGDWNAVGNNMIELAKAIGA